jgi:hypothetical protein
MPFLVSWELLFTIVQNVNYISLQSSVFETVCNFVGEFHYIVKNYFIFLKFHEINGSDATLYNDFKNNVKAAIT